MSPPRIFISAGEPSGDAHAGPVVRALLERWPEASVEALGGPEVARAGGVIRFPMDAYTVMGLAEAIGKVPAHLAALRRLREDFRQGRYDLVLLVDYPDFNLRVARAAREAGIPTLYYVAPQLWAWRRRRARLLRSAVDRLAVILPFEESFFASLGIPSAFVGHPLLDGEWPGRAEVRAELGLAPHERVLALFPGSRRQEVRRLWPAFRRIGRVLLEEGACDRVLVAATPSGYYPRSGPLIVHPERPRALLAAADVALIKSGTSTLEAACAGTPMVVAYRAHPVTAAVARRLVSLDRISLVNLVGGRDIVPEFLQAEALSDGPLRALRSLLAKDGLAARTQREGLAEVRSRLGTPGAARRVAALAGDLLAA